MEGDLIRINEWLSPLSWLYAIGVETRNALFDMSILPSRSYDIPIINIGNITVGGTGKTPHVEYLVQLLSRDYKVAVLSRGYKRRSKGYVLATPESRVEDIGDESWQMKHKFPNVYVAVDANRRRGIERLMHDDATRDVEVILLDDAFQHRYVKPGMNILLFDYHRMITDDRLLPAGRLRENVSAKRRANMVIVSKCPHDITPMGFRVIQSALQLQPFQQLYFSTLRYSDLRQMAGSKVIPLSSLRSENYHILLLTGIGSPLQMEQDLRRYCQQIKSMPFSDHHRFSDKDVPSIQQALRQLARPSIIVTTEKDATKLQGLGALDETVRDSIYILPVRVCIMKDETQTLNNNIIDYVRNNPRNSKMASGENA